MEEVERLNGEVRGWDVGRREGFGRRSLARAALLTTGMALSIGAALLLSSSSNVSWDQLSLTFQQQLQQLRDHYAHLNTN